MVRSAIRYCIEVRYGGRITASVVCGPDVTVGEGGGEGGRLVVPGVGDALCLVRGGRIQPTLDLVGEVIAADGTRESWPASESSVGARACLRVAALPEIELHITPVEPSAVIERSSVRMIPPRETVVAAGIAACLFGFFGHTVATEVLPWESRKDAVEPEVTALVHAIFTTPRVEVVSLPPLPVVLPEPPSPPPKDPDRESVPDVPVGGAAPDDGGVLLEAVETPVVVAMREDTAKRRGRSRRGRAPRHADDRELVRLLGTSSEITAVLGSTDTLEMTFLDTLDSSAAVPLERFAMDGPGTGTAEIGGLARGPGGVPGGVAGGVAGGVPGGVAGGVPGDVEPTLAPPKDAPTSAPPVDAPPGAPPGAPTEAPATPASDPRGGKFGLADAFAGRRDLARKQLGQLMTRIHTSRGVIDCELFEDRVPNTVANFVGLALGTRESLDRTTNTWRGVPLYDGTTFHRIVKGFVIQGGDPEGKGSGGPGYTIADEIVPELGHDTAGVLSMANRGPNTAGSQFFITIAGAPHIKGHTVFGHCATAVAIAIGDVPVGPQSRPTTPVTIDRVEILRAVPETTAAPGDDVTTGQPDADPPRPMVLPVQRPDAEAPDALPPEVETPKPDEIVEPVEPTGGAPTP